MFKSPKKVASPSKSQVKSSATETYNDLLMLTPSLVSILVWPTIYYLDSDVSAAIKNNYY